MGGVVGGGIEPHFSFKVAEKEELPVLGLYVAIYCLTYPRTRSTLPRASPRPRRSIQFSARPAGPREYGPTSGAGPPLAKQNNTKQSKTNETKHTQNGAPRLGARALRTRAPGQVLVQDALRLHAAAHAAAGEDSVQLNLPDSPVSDVPYGVLARVAHDGRVPRGSGAPPRPRR